MRPRSDVFQRLVRFSLDVSPTPAGRSDCLDLEGNSSSTVWFEGTHTGISICAISQVETLCVNPLDFIITSLGACNVPVIYAGETVQLLEPYLLRMDDDPAIHEFALKVIRDNGDQTVSFLCALADLISTSFGKVVRRDGAPFSPSVTLKQGRGACRDLSVLFMDICRSVGLATRFVSGYVSGSDPGVALELHAWAEVYLPGAGWRGFDPVLGLAVADRHVAVAASSVSSGVSPVLGTFRSNHAFASMDYEVSIEGDPVQNTSPMRPMNWP